MARNRMTITVEEGNIAGIEVDGTRLLVKNLEITAGVHRSQMVMLQLEWPFLVNDLSVEFDDDHVCMVLDNLPPAILAAITAEIDRRREVANNEIERSRIETEEDI